MQLCGCKDKCNYLVAQVFFKNFFKNKNASKFEVVERSNSITITSISLRSFIPPKMLFVIPEIIIDILPVACSFLVTITIRSLRQLLLLQLCL